MKHFTADSGNLMPVAMLTNLSDTVLETANDQGSQRIAPAGTSRARWNKPRLFREKDVGKSLEAKLLALGTTSVLATMMPVAADAKIVSFENQSVNLLLSQSLDVDGDDIPDVSCFYSVTDNGNVLVSCLDINGEGLSVNSDTCGTDGTNQQDGCQAGTGSAKYLQSLVKTSRDLNGWVKIKIDSDKSLAIAEAWAYEDCVGQPITVGQTSGGGECTTVIDSSGNITWEKGNSSNEGFKVYRDGILIGTTAANVTSFHDPSWPLSCASKPVTYVYVVMAISSGGDYEVGRKEFQCLPPSPSSSARLMVAIEGLGSVTTSPNTISCEASDCHADPNDPTFPKCNPQKCAAQFDEETEVTLTPHPAPGYIFGGWGNHEDCGDGKVTMRPNENKHCIVFFDKEIGRKNSSRTPPLPSQGECAAIDSSGQHIGTNAQISVAILVNGTDSQPTATVKSTDQIAIRATMRMDSQQQPAMVDILVFGSYQETMSNTDFDWMMDKDGKVFPWNKDKPADLIPFLTNVSLTAAESTTLEIYRGTPPFNTGLVKLFLGYRLKDGTMVYSVKPVEIHVVK